MKFQQIIFALNRIIQVLISLEYSLFNAIPKSLVTLKFLIVQIKAYIQGFQMRYQSFLGHWYTNSYSWFSDSMDILFVLITTVPSATPFWKSHVFGKWAWQASNGGHAYPLELHFQWISMRKPSWKFHSKILTGFKFEKTNFSKKALKTNKCWKFWIFFPISICIFNGLFNGILFVFILPMVFPTL